jgi:hypothetical protein
MERVCPEMVRTRFYQLNHFDVFSGKTAPYPHPTQSGMSLTIYEIIEQLEPTTGLEPVTCRLRIGCSTN